MREVELNFNLSLGYVFLRYDPSNETRCAWRGYLDLPADDDHALTLVWGFFQNPLGEMIEARQAPAWISKAQRIAHEYRDRSLSAGDVITLDRSQSYAVEGIGFKPVPLVTGGPLVGPEGDRRLREQVASYNTPRCPCCDGPVHAVDERLTCADERTCGWSTNEPENTP